MRKNKMLLKTGIWIEEGRLKCPYCKQPFRPRVIKHVDKQCPNCHRYFIVGEKEEVRNE